MRIEIRRSAYGTMRTWITCGRKAELSLLSRGPGGPGRTLRVEIEGRVDPDLTARENDALASM